MAGTLSIVGRKIGEGGSTRGAEVKRFQQLLYLAGYTRVGWPDGAWGKNTTAAWMEYQERYVFRPARPYVDAGDPQNKLFYLALDAGVLVPLAGEIGPKGVKAQFQTMHDMGVPYGWKDHGRGTLMTWGLQQNGNVGWGICTKPGGSHTALFDMEVTRSSNCCSFANVLLSIAAAGNLHHPKYSASQDVGGDDPAKNLSRRYGYAPLKGSPKPAKGAMLKPGLYTSLEELQADTRPGVVYHFAICKPSGFITHDTVLLDGEIYECNLDRTPACYKSSLEERWARTTKGKKYAIVSGPM